jgi:processive 1,2-diacylglycerol beta-glucosyltransferase
MKILVIHASAGAGHQKAAEAIYQGLKKYTSHEVVIKDALDILTPAFKYLYRRSYFLFISKMPWLWRHAFAILDKPGLQPLWRRLRRIYNRIHARGLHRYLIKEQFDVVIACHFMPVEVTSALKRQGKVNSKLIVCVTDYDVHHIWLGSHADKYAVATDWTKEALIKLGVTGDKIAVTGIPTNEKFAQRPDILSLKQKLGIKPDTFTVLIATGSFGIGPIEQIIDQLEGVQVIVVCGHSKKLYERLSNIDRPLVKVFGLVDNMHELMAVSNVMITKPGGLSISEALVSQLPMIFFSAIPGQEENNIKVLREYGIGISDKTIPEIAAEVKHLQSSQDAFLAAVKRTQTIARPSAVRDIVALI